MVQTIEIELSINSNTKRSLIYIKAYITGHVQGMFSDSKTPVIQITD